MYPSKNTQSDSSEKITLYTEAPTIITTPPPPFMPNFYFATKLQAMFSQSDQTFEAIFLDLIEYLRNNMKN